MAAKEAQPVKDARVFVVATPIGNLGDLTERAIRTLASANVIAAEDTRQTRKLLTYLQQTQPARGIQVGSPELIAYHDHNEQAQAARLISRIAQRGEVLALVSDAGTPCISDPGFRLVEAARAAGIPVHPVPGPSALLALASTAGLPSDRLLFLGFPPTKPKALEQEIRSWQAAHASAVFFESTRRLAQTLKVIARCLPGARVAIGRELTKLHEEIFCGVAEDAAAWADSHAVMRGEATVMVDTRSAAVPSTDGPAAEGADPRGKHDLAVRIRKMLGKGATLKDILQALGPDATAVGVGRKELYRMVLDELAARRSLD